MRVFVASRAPSGQHTVPPARKQATNIQKIEKAGTPLIYMKPHEDGEEVTEEDRGTAIDAPNR